MNIAVYCSARTNIAAECFKDAATLGHYIGSNGHMLVYGGLAMGLMETVATATAAAGGKVMGVVPATKLQRQHTANTVSIPVSSLHERKQTMEEHANVFVALDGGYGTLDEVMSALATMSFFNEPKPLLLLNRNNLYTPLIEMFNEMVSRKLMYAEVLNNITLCPTMQCLIEKLDQCAAHIKSEDI
jgi:hypothetical protein